MHICGVLKEVLWERMRTLVVESFSCCLSVTHRYLPFSLPPWRYANSTYNTTLSCPRGWKDSTWELLLQPRQLQFSLLELVLRGLHLVGT